MGRPRRCATKGLRLVAPADATAGLRSRSCRAVLQQHGSRAACSCKAGTPATRPQVQALSGTSRRQGRRTDPVGTSARSRGTLPPPAFLAP